LPAGSARPPSPAPPPRGGRGTRREKLRHAFDAAAGTYDSAAQIQRIAAQRLADRIAALPLPACPRILEIGCGTGFLTQALRERLKPASWTVTDLAPAMLDACRGRLGSPEDTVFLVMDGEAPSLEPGFDLICSSLAFQWFDDLPGAVARLAGLLKPGGHLAFSTLAEDTLLEWRAAHVELGLVPSTPTFPSMAELSRIGDGLELRDERLVHLHASGWAFLEALKDVGAGSPKPGARPLSPRQLKQAVARFETMQSAATYHVAYGVLTRTGGKPRGVFVTGTDTGVGKTVVSACLAHAWNAAYWKPIQTGLAEDPGDTTTVGELAALPAERLLSPRYAFAAPLSPDAAAAREGAAVSIDQILPPNVEGPLVVEGAGGVMVPLNERVLMIDLMARLGLPVVVVAANRLGAINQTLLALQALKARDLKVLGVVLVGPPFADNRAAIERHGGARVIAELPSAERVDPRQIEEWSMLIPPLEALLG
jgi:malonyl-CoA O-methyltransferase